MVPSARQRRTLLDEHLLNGGKPLRRETDLLSTLPRRQRLRTVILGYGMAEATVVFMAFRRVSRVVDPVGWSRLLRGPLAAAAMVAAVAGLSRGWPLPVAVLFACGVGLLVLVASGALRREDARFIREAIWPASAKA